MKETTTALDKKETSKTTKRTSTPVTSQQISLRAYDIWEKRGCTHGFDVEDWLTAELELQTEMVLNVEPEIN